jgi:hypothetical protein
MHLTLLLASVAVVFAANVRSPVPTLANPSGGPEWQLAQAFAGMVDREDLLIDAGGWGQYVRAQQSCLTLPLVSIPGQGEVYRQNLKRSIDETLDRASRVYALQVFEVTTARAVGGWEEIESRSGLRRKDLVEGLTANYRVEPAHSEPHGRTLWRIERRESEPTAESRRLERS